MGAGPAQLLPRAPGLNGSYRGHFTKWSVPLSPCLCKRFYSHVRTVPRSGIEPDKCVIVTVSGSKPHRVTFPAPEHLLNCSIVMLWALRARECPAESVDKVGHTYTHSFIHPPKPFLNVPNHNYRYPNPEALSQVSVGLPSFVAWLLKSPGLKTLD